MQAGQGEDLNAKRDPLRQPPLRYLGYANEVGEAFRSLIHVNLVRASYGIATGYVIADAIHKGYEADKQVWESKSKKRSGVVWAVVDTFAWQSLASVIIPGFTINRACAICTYTLRKTTRLPDNVRKWTVTSIGLALIPFIIEPIDRTVDHLMEASIRQYYRNKDQIQEVVKHHRND